MINFPFIPKTIENRAALRTSISALAAVLLAFKLHLDTPYWAGMTVIIVSNLYTGNIIDKALMRMAGTVVGAFFGFYLAAYIANSFLLYLLTCFLLVFFSVYYFNISRYAYAFLLFGLTAFIVITQLTINPDNAFYIAIWRSAEILLGVVVAAFGAYLLFPNHIHDSFLQQTAIIFTCFAKEIDEIKQLVCHGSDSLVLISKTNLTLKKELNKAAEMINFMRHEAGITRTILDKRRAFIDLLRHLARHFNYFVYSQRHESPSSISVCQDLPISAVFNALQQDLNTLKTAFFHNEGQANILLTHQALTALDAALLDHHPKIKGNIKFYYQLRQFLEQMKEVLGYLNALLINQSVVGLSKRRVYSRTKRLQTDPDIIKHNIKAGLSVTLAMLIWLISQWPGGINGIISSIVISIRKNIFEMKNISIYRLFGCLLGGGAALTVLFIIPLNLYDFIVLLFFLIWAFSYCSFKYPKYAYIGLQANIALVITLAQGGGPPIYLAPPLERLGGIIIGIIASFIVANSLWRTDAITMLQGRLQKLNRLLLYNSRQILMPDSKAALHDPTALFWTCRSLLELLTYEHLNPKKQALLASLKEQFAKLVFIQAIITQVDTAINQAEAHATGITLNINLKSYESLVKELYEETNLDHRKHLIQHIESELDLMENKLLYAGEPANKQILNLLAYVHALGQLARNSYLST
ncbi:FUSC family protein [Legionella nagasakiensis]|uniref:FUSC family protein n=1 Tax=Legionella nagasakiensis TaxID=535290 RepID=UPI001055286D|nr:FUSC family protein [Legionella nagasakiensis]